MAKIDSFSFGSIVVEGRKYARDLLFLPDGSVKKRIGGILKRGFAHLKLPRLNYAYLFFIRYLMSVLTTLASGLVRYSSSWRPAIS